jgi:hypothetical protein
MVKPCYDMLKLPVMTKMFGGGTAGRKIAKYIQAIRRGNLDANFDLLPTDKYEFEEKAEKKAKPVQPARKRRTAQPATKIKPVKTDKPLQENEIGLPRRSRCGEGGSNSVKVNQTDLSPASSFPNPNPNPNLPTPEDGSGPQSPTRPICPPRPTSPAESSDAREL